VGRILVLEDEPGIAEAVEMVLGLDGHSVVSTPNGKQALLLAAREGWDLIILDIDVDELSGLAVERAISDFAITPTVVFSASAGDWQTEAFRGGAAACVRKPFGLDELRALVRTLVGSPREPPAVAVENLSFQTVARLSGLTQRELDELPFGIIEVDREGTIRGFNSYEAAAVHLRPEQVLGRRFVDVAPCTEVKEFAGAVADGFRERSLDRVLRFIFPGHGALILVAVRLYYDQHRDRLWIFVSRRAPRQGDHVSTEVRSPP
jgi:photoactive yellow protein